MRREVLALGPFLASLEQRLDKLPAERLRRILMGHGTRLPPGERAGFLRIFDTADTDTAGTTATGHDDPELVGDAESFVATIVKGIYSEGCGFDPEYGDYRTFGDESWTTGMDDLLDRAGAAFLAGNATLARGAYQVLLEALADDEVGNNLPGVGTPVELIDSDVGEAKARYLRSVWESEPPATRATALVEAAQALPYLGGEPTLAALDTTRREPLPDLDRLLPDLITALGEINLEGFGFGAQARRLRAEASMRHGGVDGLAELARITGPCRAEAYRDWVDALARTGRFDDAEQAAGEALAQLDPHGGVRAGLAERLAILAAVRDDAATLLQARREAWRADPTLRRLLRLVEVATALDRRDEVLTEEAGYLAEGPLVQRPHLVALVAALLLLTGRIEETTGLMERTDQAFWEHRAHPGPVVVPFLLVGGSAASEDQRWRACCCAVCSSR
jgi:tetratricopeptide (TPR) repeat protein